MFNSGARMSQEQMELAQARIRENNYTEKFQHINPQHLEKHIKDSLSNSLIIQGKLEEALVVAPHRKEEIQALVDARDKPDDIRCSCPNRIAEGNGKTKDLEIPSEYVVQKIWCPKRQKMLWLHRCHECGHQNLVENLHPEIGAFHHYRMSFNKK